MGSLRDLPFFIMQELSGPYGPDITDQINAIIKRYNIYSTGADFETEEVKNENFKGTKLKSKKIKRLIDKQAEFMVSKPPGVKVSCPGEEKTEDGKPNESDMQAFMDTVYKKNLWSDKLLKGAKDCFIGGRVLLKANVIEDKINIMFIPADGFVYETAFDDVDTLQKVVLFYCTKDDADDKKEQRWWRQVYWMEDGTCLVNESVFDGYGQIVNVIGEHNTKLNRIPCYVIVNDGLSGDTDGESDVDTIMSEDSWYNKMRSANLDSIRKSMNQIVYISGAAPKSFGSFENTPGIVWDVPSDVITGSRPPTVGTIENTFAYSTAYANTIGNIQQSMHDALGIPDLSLESTQGLITSGKGLKALYWPLVCRCEAKWSTWKPALEWLSELLLHAAEVFPTLKKVYGEFNDDMHVITIDNQYPLPEDEAEERTLDLQEVGISRSMRSYLMEWGGADHKGLCKEDAEAEIDQLVKEKRMLEDSYEGDMTGGGE